MDTPSSSTSSQVKPLKKPKRDLETVLHHLRVVHDMAAHEFTTGTTGPYICDRSDEELIRSPITDAFWISLNEQLSRDPPSLDYAFRLLVEIKEGLEQVMTPNIVTLREKISKTIDIDRLRQEAEEGNIDVLFYAKFIINTMGMICAPARDEEVLKLKKETNLVSLFRGIVEMIAKMRNDLISFSLNMIKPSVMANNLLFERQFFREHLAIVGGALPETSKWLKKHFDDTKQNNGMIVDAYIELLEWDSNNLLPETLFLEHDRLDKLMLDFFRLSVAATLTFLSFTNAPSLFSDFEYQTSLKTTIMVLVNDIEDNECIEKVALSVATELKARIRLPLGSSSDKWFENILESLQEAADPNHHIRTLLRKRLKEYLRTSMLVSSSCDDHFPTSLSLFKKEIHDLRVVFQNIFYHNLVVCKEYYDKIINSAKTCEPLQKSTDHKQSICDTTGKVDDEASSSGNAADAPSNYDDGSD